MRRYTIGAEYSRGFLIVHSPMISAIARGPVQSAEVSFRFNAKGDRHWHAVHRHPWVGLKYMITDFSNPKQIGLVHSISPQLGFPLVRNKWFSLHSVWDIGLGFVSRPFHPQTNNKNAANSTIPNVLIQTRLEAVFRPQKYLAFTTGLSFAHWSAGAVTMPNLGMNVVAVHAGIQGRFGYSVDHGAPKPRFERKPWEVFLFGGAFAKQISYKTGNRFSPCAEINLEFNKRLTHKSSIPVGLDLFYDGSIPARMELARGIRGRTAQSFRAGIHTGYEFIVERLSLFFNAGMYFLKTDPLDHFIFARIGARYRVHPRVMIYANLKTHFFVADFIQVGAGYRLFQIPPKTKKNA